MLKRLFSIALIGTQFIVIGVLAAMAAVWVGTRYFGLQLQDRGLPMPWQQARTSAETGETGFTSMGFVVENQFHLRLVDKESGEILANFNLNPAIAALQDSAGSLNAPEILLILAAVLATIGLLINKR